MSLGRTNSTCDQSKDYTYIEILEFAAGLDCCMMEDLAINGSLETKRNLVKVASFWGQTDDGIWGIADRILWALLDRECPHCDGENGITHRDGYWECDNCGAKVPFAEIAKYHPCRVKTVAPPPDEESIRALVQRNIDSLVKDGRYYLGNGFKAAVAHSQHKPHKPCSVSGSLYFHPQPDCLAHRPTYVYKHPRYLSVYDRECRTKEMAEQTVKLLETELKKWETEQKKWVGP